MPLPGPATAGEIAWRLTLPRYVLVKSYTATKAHQKLGFLRRNLKGSPLDCKKLAYVALVHSALEYEHHMGSIPSEGRGRRGQS